MHARLPWPLPRGLALKHALLLVVSGFALQQLSGQLWRVFVTGVSGQVPPSGHPTASSSLHSRREKPSALRMHGLLKLPWCAADAGGMAGSPLACMHACAQMQEDEKGHKQLGRAHALGHLAQMVLLLALGVLAMREPWPTVGQWRAVFGGYGVIYALEASSLDLLRAVPIGQPHALLGTSHCLKASCAFLAACQWPAGWGDRAAVRGAGVQADHGPHGEGAL